MKTDRLMQLLRNQDVEEVESEASSCDTSSYEMLTPRMLSPVCDDTSPVRDDYFSPAYSPFGSQVGMV